MSKSGLAIIAAVLVTAALCGCSKKVTMQNYNTIREKVDTKADVRAKLGKPERDLNDQWIYDDINDDLTVIVYFDDRGVVAGKEISDTSGGVFDGLSPNSDNDEPRGPVRERSTNTTTYDR